MNRFARPRFTTAALLLGLTAPLALPASAQVLLRDDFDGTGNIDGAVWRVPFGGDGSFYGRTQAKTDPTLIAQQVGGAAELVLDTFLDGLAFHGGEFISRRQFARGGGLSVEYRAKFDAAAVADGLVNGLFLYSGVVREVDGQIVRDELDFELLSNQINNGNQPLTNVYNEEGFGTPGNPQFVPAVDLTQYQNYRIDWTPDAVRWYVNDNLVRTETTLVPDDPMAVHANLWAPDAGFGDAFNASLQPAPNAGANQQYKAQIDFIEVTRFNTTVGPNLLSNPGFADDSPAGVTTDPNGADGKWFLFNNAFAANSEIVDSNGDGFLLKTFGPGGFISDASGAFQDVPILPGQEIEASIDAITPLTDSIAGTNNFADMALEFLDANKNPLGNTRTVAILDGRDPTMIEGEFVTATINGLAPANAAFARLVPRFIGIVDSNGGPDPGAVFWDNASVNILEAVVAALTGDYDGSGQVEQGDLDIVLQNWGTGTFTGDEAALVGGGPFDGTVDQNELDGVLQNWGSTAAPDFAGSAVPEPAALAVLGSLGVLGLRRRGAD